LSGIFWGNIKEKTVQTSGTGFAPLDNNIRSKPAAGKGSYKNR
jgi:hypothetical protein